MSKCDVDNASERLFVLRLLNRGRRILRDGVIDNEGEWKGTDEEVGGVSWVPKCTWPWRAGVRLNFLVSLSCLSDLSIFSSRPFLILSRWSLFSNPFSASADGSSSSLVFRFLPRFSLIDPSTVISFCFACRGVRTARDVCLIINCEN